MNYHTSTKYHLDGVNEVSHYSLACTKVCALLTESHLQELA